MFTITSHIFTDIFQTVHFSTVKLTRGNEKDKLWTFFWYQNLRKFEQKNPKQSDRAPVTQIILRITRITFRENNQYVILKVS